MLQHHDPYPLHVYLPDGSRRYQVEALQYHGIGGIIQATQPQAEQEHWQQWREKPDNARKSEIAMLRGTLLHAMAEQHLRGQDPMVGVEECRDRATLPEESVEQARQTALKCWKSVQPVLPQISNPLLIESAVWWDEGCYAGTVDLVAHWQGTAAIIDWKTCESLATYSKSAGWYPLQLCAYAMAVHALDRTVKPTKGVIIAAAADGVCQVMQFDLRRYRNEWIDRLERYWRSSADLELATIALERLSDYGKRVGIDLIAGEP